MGASCFDTKKNQNIKIRKNKIFEDNNSSDEDAKYKKNKNTNQKTNKKSESQKINLEEDNKEISIKKKQNRKKEDKNENIRDIKKKKENEKNNENGNRNENNNFKKIKENIEDKKKEIEESKNKNLMKSYIPKLKIENNFYIVCPTCKFLFPTIKKFDYDPKEKDFQILYTCKCNPSSKLSKSNFLNFINFNRPLEINENFNESKMAKKLLQAAKENEDFPGKDISCNALKQSIYVNGAAPPASINKSIKDSNIIKSMFPKFKASVLNPIKEEKEGKKNSNREVIISHAFSESSKNEEEDEVAEEEEKKENLDNMKYTCDKTFQKNARISSLIELESGYLATGSYDCKICIWDINKPSGTIYEREFQEMGIIICLLEMKPNYLLAGTNNNYISLWNLNSENKSPEFYFFGHNLWVNCLVKCNEEIFASCSNDKSIMTWNFTKKQRILRFNAHDDCVLSLIKLKNGNLCSGGADLLIKIWNWKTGECLSKLEGYNNWIRCICQLNDKILLIGSENIITIWENQQVKAYLTDHEHDVRDICVINENYFASGSFDNTIKIWETKEFNCIQTLKGHNSNVIKIIKLKGTNNLASCSTDYTLKIWKPNYE